MRTRLIVLAVGVFVVTSSVGEPAPNLAGGDRARTRLETTTSTALDPDVRTRLYPYSRAAASGTARRAPPWARSSDTHLWPMVPVAGVTIGQLEDTFGHPRPDDREHLGIDIPAPIGTPVIAAADGWVVAMPEGGAGGLALFLVDRSGQYLFYYAHLDGYANLLWAGRPVRQGEVLGYVGDSGNAQGRDPHLHFEVAMVHDPQRWWEYEPLNPYEFLTVHPPQLR